MSNDEIRTTKQMQSPGCTSGASSFRHSNFTTRQLIALIGLLIFFIGFGINTEIRSALIHERHTDVGAYFSAAWSIRIGSDPYDARDRNGWHYTYPPLLAVLLDPLADAPPGMHRYWLIPYAVSVGIWYLLSIAFLILAVDQLARVLTQRAPPGIPTRTWWMLFSGRLFCVCPPLGEAWCAGRSVRSGCC